MSKPTYVPAGFLVFEDILVKTLEQGFQNILSDLTLLDELFPTIDKTEREQIKDYFRLMKKMTVLHGYARMDAKMPQWVVTLAGERTVAQFLGEEENEFPTGIAIDDDIISQQGELEGHEIKVTTYATDNPLRTIVLYLISKIIVLQNLQAFEELGIQEVEIAGSDLGPRPEFGADLVYARTLTIAYKSFSILNMRCRKIVDIQLQNVVFNPPKFTQYQAP